MIRIYVEFGPERHSLWFSAEFSGPHRLTACMCVNVSESEGPGSKAIACLPWHWGPEYHRIAVVGSLDPVILLT